jgi:hypothetical protein
VPVSVAAGALLHLNAYCGTEFSHVDEKYVHLVRAVESESEGILGGVRVRGGKKVPTTTSV